MLIRAHGCSRHTLARASKLGYKIIDVTCPMVKEIHKIARKLEDRGFRIIIIGDKQHDEVQGIIGQLKSKATVIDKLQNIPLARIKKFKKAGLVVQSTQNLDNVLAIIELLRKYIPKIAFHNTICNPTRIKQNEIKTMPLENSVMIIIGSKTSANTKRIYEISKSLNPNSHWINSAKEIKKTWLNNCQGVGITTGASTPKSSIEAIIAKIKTICPS
ncbi:MAG: 4-hydroxy-3-methylbut-2-enyl diphosphate reductase [Candidatus Omnitrophota bacterium]